MALRRLRTLGHVAAVVHSEYEGAMGQGRGGVVSGPLSQQRRERCQKLIIHAGYGREIESAAGSTTGLSEQEGAKALKLELLAESGLLSGMI